MKQKGGPVVYKGMTREELVAAWDVFPTIEDPIGWLHANRERAEAVAGKLDFVRNVSYGPEEVQRLDIYPAKERGPVLVDIHGGGWTMGSRMPRSLQAEAINGLGATWIPIDYGLAPQYGMGKIVAHVRQALAWVYQNVAEYGGDPERIFVTGNSSGGHLVATCLMPGWLGEYGLPDDLIKGAIASSGIFDLDPYVYAEEGPQEALKMTLEEARRWSPLYHLPERALPVILAYGEIELEAYIQASTVYAEALRGAGCDVTLIEVPHAHHFDMINAFGEANGDLFAALAKLITA